MTNNYIFQRLLATFDLSRDHDLINEMFALGGHRQTLNKSLVKSWKTHNIENKCYRPMPDDALICFLDGIQQATIDERLILIYND